MILYNTISLKFQHSPLAIPVAIPIIILNTRYLYIILSAKYKSRFIKILMPGNIINSIYKSGFSNFIFFIFLFISKYNLNKMIVS